MRQNGRRDKREEGFRREGNPLKGVDTIDYKDAELLKQIF